MPLAGGRAWRLPPRLPVYQHRLALQRAGGARLPSQSRLLGWAGAQLALLPTRCRRGTRLRGVEITWRRAGTRQHHARCWQTSPIPHDFTSWACLTAATPHLFSPVAILIFCFLSLPYCLRLGEGAVAISQPPPQRYHFPANITGEQAVVAISAAAPACWHMYSGTSQCAASFSHTL